MQLKTKDRAKLLMVLELLLLTMLLMMSLGLLAVIKSPPEPLPLPQSTPVPTAPPPTPYPTPTPTPSPEPTPQLRERTELLTLVNPWNELPEGYEPELSMVEEEEYVDVRCAEALLTMLDDCRAAGNAPYICSAYRTMEKQKYLFNNKIARLVASGVSESEAPALAARSVAIPGTSEHQLGLAVDIIDFYYTNLDRAQEDTSTQQWLMENCWRYGFILRYPSDKSDVTGIIYEPWHYRFVGEDAAAEMYEQGLTLEEYLELYYEPLSAA